MRLIVDSGDDTLEIVDRCVVTGEEYRVNVYKKDWTAWKSGTLAQRAFPYLSPGDREFLISRTSPKGWDIMFPPGPPM